MFEEYARMLQGVEDAHTRSRMIATWARQLRVSRQRVYRELAKAGWRSGRQVRSDRGDTAVSGASLELLSAAMRSAVRDNGKATMHIPVARQSLGANGIEFAGMSNEHLARLLKDRSLDLATQKGCRRSTVRMRSLHPNHVHMVDPSLCLLYYLPDHTQSIRRIKKKPGDRQQIISDADAYKNKPFLEKRGELKVWRYVLADHRTGSISVRYYQQPGESMVALWDFLVYAWSPKENPLYAFHGVPSMLVWDSGSANVSRPIVRACEALDVSTSAHMPRQPWVKGSVEVANNIVETHFESRLRFQPVDSVEQLNAAVDRWVAVYNADQIKEMDCRLHRTGARPFVRLDAWMMITPEQLRELPEEAKELLTYQPVRRKVAGDLTISVVHPRIGRRSLYRVGGIPGVRVGGEVEVQPRLMDAGGAVRVRLEWEGEKIEEIVPPVMLDELGQPMDGPVWGESYRANPETHVDLIARKLDNLTGPGRVPLSDLNDGAGLRALDAVGEASGREVPLPRRGAVIDTRREPVIHYTHVEAAKRVMARMGPGWLPEYYQEIKRRLPEASTQEEIDALADELLGGAQRCAQ